MKHLTHWLAAVSLVAVAVAQVPVSAHPIEDAMSGKTHVEKVEYKAKRVEKLKIGTFDDPIYGNRIEVTRLKRTPAGIEYYARAWKDGVQLGFEDGTVEIQHVHSSSVPVLVDDPNGDITHYFTDRNGNRQPIRLREDPMEATKILIARQVNSDARPSDHIIPGKTGNTTGSCSPNSDTETLSFDGYTTYFVDNSTWATAHDATTDNLRSDTNTVGLVAISDGTNDNTFKRISRAPLLCDTSFVGSTNTVTAATYSIKAESKDDALGITPTLNFFTVNTASNTGITTTDYDPANWGTTGLATAVTYASFTAGSFSDFVFNATGRAAISKTSITKVGIREATYDAPNSPPTTSNNGAVNETYMEWYAADETGSASDPLFTVTYSAAASSLRPAIIF